MNNFQIKAYVFNNLKDIQLKLVDINDKNYILVRKRLEYEKKRAINILRDLEKQGKIKWINKPKNTQYKKELKILVNAKKQTNNSISKIKEIYHK